jgi:broad specificity phosphatase PhoE
MYILSGLTFDHMKIVSILLLIICTMVQCSHTKLYIVRHAEKSTQPADNPDLTVDGRQRAEDLASMLKNSEIKTIYSTETSRTQQTAAPLSIQKGITVQPYKNDTLPKFLHRVLDAGQNALIVGHSNTVIKMLRELGLQPSINEIADNDYDNFFIVTLKSRNGPGNYQLKLKQKTYGKKSPSEPDSNKASVNMK